MELTNSIWRNCLLLSALLVLTGSGRVDIAIADSRNALPLTLVRDIPLPGHAARLDYESFDSRSRLLFIAALGDGSIDVVDTTRQRLASTVANVSAAHGVLAIPELGRVYASATGTDELIALDERTLRVIGRTPAGDYPDGIAYDPKTTRIFVSDEHGGTVTVIATATTTRIATIALGGESGNIQYDPGTQRMVSAEQTHNRLIEIDPRTLGIVGRVSLPGCAGSHGLYIDAPARSAFVACENNSQLIVINLNTMREVQSVSVGDTPDVLAFDAGLRRLYVASESGIVSVFHERFGRLRLLGQAFLAHEAHTVAVDPATHLVYFALENVNGRPALRVMRPTRLSSHF